MYDPHPILEASPGLVIYTYRTGRRFVIVATGRHAQDCAAAMVMFRNSRPTDDAPEGTNWFVTESLLLKQFYTKGEREHV